MILNQTNKFGFLDLKNNNLELNIITHNEKNH